MMGSGAGRAQGSPPQGGNAPPPLFIHPPLPKSRLPAYRRPRMSSFMPTLPIGPNSCQYIILIGLKELTLSIPAKTLKPESGNICYFKFRFFMTIDLK